MSASFHEVQFPPSISQGATGGPRFSTTVIVLSSGYEQRNINWSMRRGEWDVSTGLRTPEQIEQLMQFYHARYGRAYGFRFKDWSDYQCPRWLNTPGDLFPLPVFFTTDGSTASFQLTKVYGDAAATYVRNIYKPVAGTVKLLANGVQTFDFSVDTTTGTVTLGATTTATKGVQIAGSFQFDTPCRFDTDDMKITTTTINNFAWQAIPVVEIRDI